MTPGNAQAPIERFLAVTALLDTPRLSRIYTHILVNGPTTVDETATALDIPSPTVYQDVDVLDEHGAIHRNRSKTPQPLTADPIVITVNADGEEADITPALIAAVGQAEVNEDFGVFLDRNGVGVLAEAIDIAVEHYCGRITQRTAASKLDVHNIEAMTVIVALRDVFQELREHDPKLEPLRGDF